MLLPVGVSAQWRGEACRPPAPTPNWKKVWSVCAVVRLLIPRERVPGETRVAATPETVRRLSGRGARVEVERGAGLAAGFLDDDYDQAGAVLHSEQSLPWHEADAVLCVQTPGAELLSRLQPRALLVGLLSP
jgi:NAD(P) transhydrogenase subunit alpha